METPILMLEGIIDCLVLGTHTQCKWYVTLKDYKIIQGNESNQYIDLPSTFTILSDDLNFFGELAKKCSENPSKPIALCTTPKIALKLSNPEIVFTLFSLCF